VPGRDCGVDRHSARLNDACGGGGGGPTSMIASGHSNCTTRCWR
jgi:hypothetical protein